MKTCPGATTAGAVLVSVTDVPDGCEEDEDDGEEDEDEDGLEEDEEEGDDEEDEVEQTKGV